MALHWRIVPFLAAVWLLMLGGLHWVLTPLVLEREAAEYRTQANTTLRRLAEQATPLLKERVREVGPRLDAVLRANPGWIALDLRDPAGRTLQRAHPPAQATPSAYLRDFSYPITDGGIVLGSLAARVDATPAVAAIRASQRELLLLLLAGLAAVLVVTGLAIRWFVERPLARLAFTVSTFAKTGDAGTGGYGDVLARVRESIDGLRETIAQRSRELDAEAARCRQAEERLQASEERYVLAVRGAGDGLWEWDLASGKVFYSARWKSMLGYAEHEIGDEIDEWRNRIHPEDRPHTLNALQAHLDGTTVRFECDHQLQHRDGRYRSVLARATTLRSATGKPYRLVGLNTDISARKRAEEVLFAIADGLSSTRGDEFFRALVRNFAQVLRVNYAFIAECMDQPTTRVHKLASWKYDEYAEANEFELAGTPCHETIGRGQVCVYARDVGVVYPREKGWQSYLGIPIFDVGGTVIGHLACYHGEPMVEDLPVQSIFLLFSVRAGVEMERRSLQRKLAAIAASEAK